MVYKMPKVEGFGEKRMAEVKARLNAIMRRHLIPAGHEFSKVLHDFDRLRQGRDLFDRNALEAIAVAVDNNERLDLLDGFTNHVLPNYDDVQAVWPEIRATLLQTIGAARDTEPVEIETGFGAMPGATADRVEAKIAAIFKDLRYLEVEQTLDDALDHYASALTESARGQWLGVLKSLSENNIRVWRIEGPTVQLRLIQHIAKFEPDRRNALRAPLLTILGNAMKTSASGAFAITPDQVSLEEAALPASEALGRLRAEALRMLMELFETANSDPERAAVISIFSAATRPPHNVRYGDEAHSALIRDAVEIVAFYGCSLRGLSFELKQRIEHDLLLLHHRYRALPDTTGPGVRSEAPILLDAIIAFKEALNADSEFVIYKTLVGFRSVSPEAWNANPFDHRRDQAHREATVTAFVEEMSEDNLPAWLDRIQRCAATQSRDGATFPIFATFMVLLGEKKPDLVLRFIGMLSDPAAAWVPQLLQGLAKAARFAEIEAQLNRWIAERRLVPEVLRYLRLSEIPSVRQLRAAFSVVHERGDNPALLDASVAAVRRRMVDPALIQDVALPALTALTAAKVFHWISELSFLEHEKLLAGAFLGADGQAVLRLIEAAPVIDYDDEMVLEVLTRGDRIALLDLFEARLIREEDGERADLAHYEAVPFRFQSLAEMPELGDLAPPFVQRAYGWFMQDPNLFEYRGGRVLKNFFPGLTQPLEVAILALVDGGAERAGDFAVSLLRAYSGEVFPLELARQLVARLSEGAEAIEGIDIVLSETGVVSGAFGFVDAYRAKAEALEPWLEDEVDRVRTFAKRFRHRLSQRIASEQQRAEESEAMRRLEFETPQAAADPAAAPAA